MAIALALVSCNVPRPDVPANGEDPHDGSLFHEAGLMNPDSDHFHGRLVAAGGWTMESCRQCHGQDYQGGMGGTCLGCHPARPDDCATCHSAPHQAGPFRGLRDGKGPGAHDLHLIDSERFSASDCAACHVVPGRLDDPGHLTGKVDVIFHGLALARGAEPVFDEESATCASSACHGAGLQGGTRMTQSWFEQPPPPSCVGCHGMPPETIAGDAPHPSSDRCEMCHLETAGPGWTIARPDLHGNGGISALPGSAGCSACHSGPDDSAPFRGLEGSTDATHSSVGAHSVHLEGRAFSGGMSCVTCHPDYLSDPDQGDHMSGTVTFSFSGAAAFGGLSPTWDPESRTCSSTWCHGGALGGGATVSPRWNDPGSLVCGSCHGVPPETLRSGAPHPDGATCGSCHGDVIDDAFGWVDVTRHADGVVDTRP